MTSSRGAAVVGSNARVGSDRARPDLGWRTPAPRLVGALSVGAGIAIVSATLLAHSFSRAAAGEAATNLVRSELSVQGVRRHRADFELVRSAVVAFYRDAIPALAGALRQDPAALRAELGSLYPSLGRYATDAQISADIAFAEKIVANLERRREDFVQADQIPLGPLPMTAGPWISLGAGAALAVAGVGLIVRPGRPALVPVLILGVVLVVGPFAAGFPQRANAGKRVLDSLTITPDLVARTREIFDNARAAVIDVDRRVLPDLAARLGITRHEFKRTVIERHPAVAAGLEAYPAVMTRYERRVRIRETGFGMILEAKKYPLDRVVWWSVVPGALLLLASGLALWLSRHGTRGHRKPAELPTETAEKGREQ